MPHVPPACCVTLTQPPTAPRKLLLMNIIRGSERHEHVRTQPWPSVELLLWVGPYNLNFILVTRRLKTSPILLHQE
jgi:hypothetical protein